MAAITPGTNGEVDAIAGDGITGRERDRGKTVEGQDVVRLVA
jgi:hypothetical protein